MTFPVYTFSEFPLGRVCLGTLQVEFKALSFDAAFVGFTADAETVTVIFDGTPTPTDIVTCDAAVAAHDFLAGYKTQKVERIDSHTVEVIERGFEFPPSSGLRFSLSIAGQIKVIGADIARNEVGFSYPVTWGTLDDVQTIALPDAATLHNFFLVGLATYRVAIDSGTALKSQVRAATTIAEVDAVVDQR